MIKKISNVRYYHSHSAVIDLLFPTMTGKFFFTFFFVFFFFSEKYTDRHRWCWRNRI